MHRLNVTQIKSHLAGRPLGAAKHLVAAAHLNDRDALDRLNSAVIFALVAGGLAACAIGAVIYDAARLFSAW